MFRRTLGLRLTRQFHSDRAVHAGHSKWQNIKHKKARNDKERSAANTKLAHMITVAAREGGGPDPTKNIRLATLVDTALKQNLSKRVIDTAISRATKTAGPGQGAVTITYEGIGPGGVAFIVEALTDNKNRTAQNVRAAFVKYKGNLSPCQFVFERRGFIALDTEGLDHDSVFDTVIDFGVEDVLTKDDQIILHVAPQDLSAIAAKVKEHYKLADMGLLYDAEPSQEITSLDNETAGKVLKTAAALEGIDDVTAVYMNYRKD